METRRQLGETFGHVVPGVFYGVMSLGLLFWTWRHAHHGAMTGTLTDAEVYAATNGGASFLRVMGGTTIVVAGTGIVLEAAGGLITFGDAFYQLAHETMYFGFLLAGLACLLEAARLVAVDTWRMAIGLAFFCEGLIFYGHQLEQKMTEQALHFVMVMLSFGTAACFWWATRRPRALLFHVAALALMQAKAMWFFIVAHVLYSGKYGHEGMDFMTGDVYTAVALVLFSVAAAYGLVFVKRRDPDAPEGFAPEAQHHSCANGNGNGHHQPVRQEHGAKYDRVATDAGNGEA